MGWACPLANPTNYQISFTAKHNSLYSNDTTRWFSIFIGNDDDTEYRDLTIDLVEGYHILVRANGTLSIYKKAKGGAVAQVANINR